MTDLYGVRVLALDPSKRYVRLRAVVLYYDTSPPYADPPDDSSFFFRLLWEAARDGAPLGDLVTIDEILDESWVDANTRWFIESVERVAVHNHPFTAENVEQLAESGGRDDDYRWLNEDHHMHADYDVVVTDPRWLGQLELEDWWSTPSHPTRADLLRPHEAGAVPDLRSPVVVLSPFEVEPHDQLAFSDDGRYLAVTSTSGELAVLDTTEWRECVRVHPDGYSTPRLMWVPGQHVITLGRWDDVSQLAYDAASGNRVEAPRQVGDLRSPTGRYRVGDAPPPSLRLISESGEDRVVPTGKGEKGWLVVRERVAFPADESVMLVARGATVYAMDPADGRAVATIGTGDARITTLRVSPGGDYLATSTDSGVKEVSIRRVSDYQVVTRQQFGPEQTPDVMAWSPDGRRLAVSLGRTDGPTELRVFPIGLPAEPPAEHGRVKADQPLHDTRQ